MAESAVSSSNKRAFEAIMNCSAQWMPEKNDLVTDVCKRCAIYGISVFKRDERGRKSCERGMEGVVTGRVRSVSSRSW